MKIAHVIRRISFFDWGGTEQVVWNLAKAQLAAGHDVRLFATTALYAQPHKEVAPSCPAQDVLHPGVPAGVAQSCAKLRISRFHPIYPWWPMRKSLIAQLDRKGGNPFVPGMGRALREWRPDVIHCHAMGRIAELCLRVGERGTGNGERGTGNREQGTGNGERIKCVISLHGGGAKVPEAEAKSLVAPTRHLLPWGKAVDILMGWTRRVPEDFGGIVCVGEDEADYWRSRHPHVLFLPNGVDTALYAQPHKEVAPSCQAQEVLHPGASAGVAQTCAKGHSKVAVLCVARIDRQKNQKSLVEALARNPSLTLRLAGPVTQPDYREELERRAAELGVSDRLSFAGALPPGSKELVSEYHAADVFALASRHEPFGIVVLEAWAAGLPVVASDVGGLGRLCAAHKGAALTFPPDDAAALDNALARACSDEALRSSLSAAGRAAAARYDWRALSDSLVDFYSAL